MCGAQHIVAVFELCVVGQITILSETKRMTDEVVQSFLCCECEWARPQENFPETKSYIFRLSLRDIARTIVAIIN